MSEKVYTHQQELAKLTEQYTGLNGIHATSIPSLFLIRKSTPNEPISKVEKPSQISLLSSRKQK
ncbi:hypothetical protein [Priestia endophytica]|uniref:hypothetical protein n=1 Tax=Priestia endophytica TaxID=135735 RepID=UPI002282D101|nr:hypothetical protein [Priestia endophytica]MCY8232357.1 hypothetical protein [Priestia endophytica]